MQRSKNLPPNKGMVWKCRWLVCVQDKNTWRHAEINSQECTISSLRQAPEIKKELWPPVQEKNSSAKCKLSKAAVSAREMRLGTGMVKGWLCIMGASPDNVYEFAMFNKPVGKKAWETNLHLKGYLVVRWGKRVQIEIGWEMLGRVHDQLWV